MSYLTKVRITNQRTGLQRMLYLLAFTALGVGDAVTGAMLMGSKGSSAEANIMFRYLYETEGPAGFIAIKIWLTFCILLLVHFIYIRSDGQNYWSVNGLLVAFIVGGIMAVQANFMAYAGLPHISSASIVLVYLIFALCLIEAGDRIDAISAKKSATDRTLKPDEEQLNIPAARNSYH